MSYSQKSESYTNGAHTMNVTSTQEGNTHLYLTYDITSGQNFTKWLTDAKTINISKVYQYNDRNGGRSYDINPNENVTIKLE